VKLVTLLALACIPLQWFQMIDSPIGELRAHQLALFALTGVIIAVYGFARIGAATRRLQFFILANVYMLILTTAMDVYHGIPPIQPTQSLLYLISFVAISGYFFMIAKERVNLIIDALRWSALFTLTVLLMAFGVSLLKNGINPLQVVQQTIVTGDPSILTQQLFGQAFIGFGFDLETTQVQLRHEVFGALLLSMYIASWAKARRPLTERNQLFYYRLAMVAGALLVLLSLSRAVTLAALLWPLILLARAMMSGRVSGTQLSVVFATLIGLAGLATSGFLSVIYDRFAEDTRGYESRTENILLAIDRIGDNFWTGGITTEGTSSHNFLLDNFQRGGILVFIPTLVVFLYVFGLWLSLLLRIRTLPAEMIPVAAALTLPLFRMMTQGGGQISVNGWMAMAFVTGVVHATLRRGKAIEPDVPADEDNAEGTEVADGPDKVPPPMAERARTARSTSRTARAAGRTAVSTSRTARAAGRTAVSASNARPRPGLPLGATRR